MLNRDIAYIDYLFHGNYMAAEYSNAWRRIKTALAEAHPQADNNRSDEIAWLNETLKMINLRGHYTDINESLTDRINERIAQLRAMR